MKGWLSVLVLLTACAKSPRTLYTDALWDQTRAAFVGKDAGTALRMRATYLSGAFRDAMAAERARLMGEAITDQAAWRAQMAEDAAAYHEVVFTAESPMHDELRFGDDDRGWRLRLVADGVEEPVVTVFRVRDVTLLQASLYAHKNEFNDLFIARFARTVAAPAEVVLHVGSGYGHDSVRWTGEELR